MLIKGKGEAIFSIDLDIFDTVLMSYARLSRRPLLFKSFTGLEITEFDIISKEIESKYYEHEIKRLSNRKRKRDVGAGRPFKLKLRERFLMLLVYYRLYITFTLSGFLFDLDQSNVCRDICMLEPLVRSHRAHRSQPTDNTRENPLGLVSVEGFFKGF
jgi:Helix-turn-helix of DDE superfamily endonuclease